MTTAGSAVAGTEAANQLNTSQFLAIVWGFLQLMRGGREFTRKQTEEIRRRHRAEAGRIWTTGRTDDDR